MGQDLDATGNETDGKALSRRLWDHLVHLDTLWQDFQYLYGESQERLDRLNRHARWFFASLERLMVREVILSIARLTDPKGGSDRSNLVLETLLDDPLLESNTELRERLRVEIDNVRNLADPIRHHRHKSIAHLDLAVAMGSAELPELPKKTVNEVIGRMQYIHHTHYSELYQSDVSYELYRIGSVEDLLRSLDDAAKWRDHERIERYREHGLEPPEHVT